jgi:hypothetical protein
VVGNMIKALSRATAKPSHCKAKVSGSLSNAILNMRNNLTGGITFALEHSNGAIIVNKY